MYNHHQVTNFLFGRFEAELPVLVFYIGGEEEEGREVPGSEGHSAGGPVPEPTRHGVLGTGLSRPAAAGL